MESKHLRGVAAKLERAESFQHSLDVLMEICGDLGYTQISYAFQKFSPVFSTAAGCL